MSLGVFLWGQTVGEAQNAVFPGFGPAPRAGMSSRFATRVPTSVKMVSSARSSSVRRNGRATTRKKPLNDLWATALMPEKLLRCSILSSRRPP